MIEGSIVFISYSHDSGDQVARVVSLANQLRRDGIDCWIDQFEPHPPQGWPMWMEQQIEKAEFVLLVCTQRYLDRFNGVETKGVGLGVAWESLLVRNELYASPHENTKFIPVGFEKGFQKFVPKPLLGNSRFLLGDLSLKNDASYRNLYAVLTEQSLTPAEKIGGRKSLSALSVLHSQPDLASIEDGSQLLLKCLLAQPGDSPPRHDVLYAMRYLGFDFRRPTIRDFILENHQWLFDGTPNSIRDRILHDFRTGLDELRSVRPAEIVLCVGSSNVARLGSMSPAAMAPVIWLPDFDTLRSFLFDPLQYGEASRLRVFAVVRRLFVEVTGRQAERQMREAEEMLEAAGVHLLHRATCVVWGTPPVMSDEFPVRREPESLEALLKTLRAKFD